MLTGDKLFKIVSLLLFVGFILFSIIVSVKEILKSDDLLQKTADANCFSLALTGGEKLRSGEAWQKGELESEDDFVKSGYACLFVSKQDKKGRFAENLFKRGPLKKSDYLYVGDRGVLIKRDETDFSYMAKGILDCLKKGDCSFVANSKDIVSVTISLLDQKDARPVEVTFSDEPLNRMAKSGRALIEEMAAVKKIKTGDMRLNLAFHKSYALIDSKDEEYIDSLLKEGLDGLYLKARGAKIRLMPWEYGLKAVRAVSRKGAQYGLKKDEFKETLSTIYAYRTVQFREKDGVMNDFLGNYFAEKSGYSDELMKRYYLRYIINAQQKDGSFTELADLQDGLETAKSKKLFTQILALDALTRYCAIFDDADAESAIGRSLAYIIGAVKNENIVNRFYLYDVIKNGKNAADESVKGFLKETEDILASILKGEAGEKWPEEFTGIVINAMNTWAKEGKNKAAAEKYIDEIKKSFAGKFMKKPYELAIRAYSFYAAPEFSGGMVRVIAANIRGDDDFIDYNGGIPRNKPPESGVTSEAIKAVSLYKTSADLNSFLKFMTVTNDDSVKWKTTEAKKIVTGGIRTGPASDKISLFATANALIYLTNKTIGDK